MRHNYAPFQANVNRLWRASGLSGAAYRSLSSQSLPVSTVARLWWRAVRKVEFELSLFTFYVLLLSSHF